MEGKDISKLPTKGVASGDTCGEDDLTICSIAMSAGPPAVQFSALRATEAGGKYVAYLCFAGLVACPYAHRSRYYSLQGKQIPYSSSANLTLLLLPSFIIRRNNLWSPAPFRTARIFGISKLGVTGDRL